MVGTRSARSGVAHFDAFSQRGHGRDALPRDPRTHVRRSCRVQRLRGSIRSGASGVACLAPSFAVSAMRARECRLYWALSMIAPSVNVLHRTRRKPSTIRATAPDVVIGQSTAAPAGARPYHSGGKRFARLSYVDAHAQRRSRRSATLPRHARAGRHHHYMRGGALAKDPVPKGIPTWNFSFGIHGMDRRFPEAMFTMLNDCYELG